MWSITQDRGPDPVSVAPTHSCRTKPFLQSSCPVQLTLPVSLTLGLWKHKCLMAPSELRSYMQPGGLRVSLSRGFPRKLEAEMEHSCPTPAKDSGK